MRRVLVLWLVAVALCAVAVAQPASGATGAQDGLVYRYYVGYGYRFQPLLSFARLNEFVSERRIPAVRRLVRALIARGVRRGDSIYWEYDFPYGGPAPWTSGFAQAVAAQALARSGILLADASLLRAADAAFRALERGHLVIPLGGGLWVLEYGFTRQTILNAQLQSVISIATYAAIARTPAAQRMADRLYVAARRLLPRFRLGCWSRYQLGGGPATLHYHAYHVDLLRRLMLKHPEPIWRSTYRRWSRCL